MHTMPDGNIKYHRHEEVDGKLTKVEEVDQLPHHDPNAVQDKRQVANKRAQEHPLRKPVWQLLPYTEGQNYISDKIWWNRQVVRNRYMMFPITVGFVFQGVGAGERSDNHVAVRKATQRAEDRFKLPMVHCFLHV
jgi:hypothetical protein